MQAHPSLVLIIDDDAHAREALRGLLFNQGYHLEFAENGEEGLELAIGLQPDLILLDVMMPELDGFEVCRRLRQNPDIAEIPVIMVTALDDQDSRLAGIQAGADDFVSKPYNRLELRARVAAIARLNRYRRLLAERNKFAWLVEHSDEAYLLIDSESACTYANAPARAYLNLPAEGGNFLVHARRHYQLEPQLAWENWPHPNELSAPRCLIRPESSEEKALWLEVEILQVGKDSSEGFLVRLRDVSEKMLLQQQTWTFQQLLAHKLRTPMTACEVLGMLKNKLQDKIDEKSMNFLNIALMYNERQKQQLDKVFHHIQSPMFAVGNTSKGFVLSQLPLMLEEIRQNMEFNSDIELVVSDDLAETRLALSPQSMEVIIQELLENARKFHPGNAPRVTLEVTRNEKEKTCLLRVSDNGRHLPVEELDKVWLPYHQIERYFTGEVPGMGLGLSTVASILWTVGGQCRLYNREDEEGVRVNLDIPCVK